MLEDGILHYATTRQDVSQGPGLGHGRSLPQDALSRQWVSEITQSRVQVPGTPFAECAASGKLQLALCILSSTFSD